MEVWVTSEGPWASVVMGNTTTDEDSNLQRNETLVIWEITTLLVIFLLTVFGNIVVLFMLLVRRKKLTRMCYFILSLCISDLVTAFFNVLPQMAWDITYRFRGNDFLCKAVKFGQLLGPYLNSYLLVMTALDRYQVICYPLSNCAWTPRRSKNMIFLAWILALFSCTPQLKVFSYKQLDSGTWDCWASFEPIWTSKAYVTWYAVSVFILPLICLIFVYSRICRTLWVNFKLKQMDEQSPPIRHETQRPRLLVRLRSQRQSTNCQVSTCIDSSLMPEEELQDSTSTALSTPMSTSVTTHNIPVDHGNGNSTSRGRNGMSLRFPNNSHLQACHPPRSHSIRSISRAKIKTVKLTVTVILCYVVCSAPFISVQLWHVWDPNAESSPFYNGRFSYLSFLGFWSE